MVIPVKEQVLKRMNLIKYLNNKLVLGEYPRGGHGAITQFKEIIEDIQNIKILPFEENKKDFIIEKVI